MAADKASGNSRPTMPGNTYTIGQLAKLLGLPASTLRYYDAQGLLTPALRDETNQYRYYTEEQVMEAMNIIQLKRLGISLQDIKLILQHKRLLDLNQNLADKMAEYQKQIEQLKIQYQYVAYNYRQLNTSLSLLAKHYAENNNGDIMDFYSQETGFQFDYEISYLAPTQIVYQRFLNHFYISDNELRANLALNDFIHKHHLQLAGPLTIVFFDEANLRFQGGKYEVEMFYPIEPTTLQHPMLDQRPGQWVISRLHLGDYDELPQVFEMLHKRIAEENLKPAGPPFEQYLVDYLYLNNKSSFLTRVGVPIAEPPPQHPLK